MGERKNNFTDDFKREAVRISRESGRTVDAVAKGLGVGKSTLTAWRRRFREEDLLSGPHDDLETENARLRRENEILLAERDLLKKATALFAKEPSR